MRAFRVVGTGMLGLIGGFLLGLLLSELVAILGLLTSGGVPRWMRVFTFVPWALAVVGALAAPTVLLRSGRK